MKKGIWLGILLVFVIGGYFVGTKLFQEKEHVTENGEQKQNNLLEQEKKVPRMVKVNGILYYDTGKLPTVEARCGTPDGFLETILPNEIPTVDNTSNFGRYGYQYVDENTIEVDLPTGWTVFSIDEKEAVFGAPKNYVTIKDGQIDNQQLIDEFLERVENQYDANLTFLKYNEDATAQYYYLHYYQSSNTVFDHGYSFIVDAFQEDGIPQYLYSFQSLDTTNGMTLKGHAYIGILEFAGPVFQRYDEEFIIY